MKKLSYIYKSVLFLLLCTGFQVAAQDYAKVDNIVNNYPKSFSDTDKFAAQINKDFTRDDEKARAIFTWLATNVKYDLAAYNVNARPVAYSFKTQAEKEAKQKKFKDDLALKTLKSKKGVCQGYATLFLVVAEKVGLESEIVTGTSKSHPSHIGKAPGASDHAWNVVRVNGNWKFVDATWGAGTVTGQKPAFVFRFNDGYFFTNPEQFFLNHYPDDEKWLLTKKTPQDFAGLPLYYGNYLDGGYNFVSPATGTLSGKKADVAVFKIENLKSTDKVAYLFTKTNQFMEITPQFTGDTALFEVNLGNVYSGYLTIFINQKSVAAYRINGK